MNIEDNFRFKISERNDGWYVRQIPKSHGRPVTMFTPESIGPMVSESQAEIERETWITRLNENLANN